MKIRKSRLRMAHNNLFEWSLNGRRWYPINRNKMILAIPAHIERAMFNVMLHGNIVEVKARYFKPKLHILSVDPSDVMSMKNRIVSEFAPATPLLFVQCSLSGIDRLEDG